MPALISFRLPQTGRSGLSLGGQTIVFDGAENTITAGDETFRCGEELAGSEALLVADRYTLKLHLCDGKALLALPVRWTGSPALTAEGLCPQITPLRAATQE